MKKFLILCACFIPFFVSACAMQESSHAMSQQIDTKKGKDQRFVKGEVLPGKVLLILATNADVEVVKSEVKRLGGEVLSVVPKQSVVVVKAASSSQGELEKYQHISGVKSAEWNQKRSANQ